MRKIILLVAVTVLLVSCGKIPAEKLALTKHCIDSLKIAGAENSLNFPVLKGKLVDIESGIEVQNSKLFRKYFDIEKEMDEVIGEARSFIITNDAHTKKAMIQDQTVVINSNSVRLEVQIDFDSNQDALKIANLVDQAVRSNINLNAKLIRIKIIE